MHPVIVILSPYLTMGSVTQFLLASLLLFISKFSHRLFSSITSFLLRFHVNGGSMNENVDDSEEISTSVIQDSIFIESEPELQSELAGQRINDVGFTESEEEKPEGEEEEFRFTFRFPTFEEYSKTNTPSFTATFEALDDQLDNSATKINCDSLNEEPSPVSSNRLLNSGEELTNKDWYWGSSDLDSYKDGFLSDEDFGGGVECSGGEMSELEENGETESDDFDDDMMGEIFGLEEGEVTDESKDRVDENEGRASEFASEEEFDADSNQTVKLETEEGGGKEYEEDSQVTDGSELKGSKDDARSELEESSNLETLWEHQDLIEQLKMELKKVRATGLPTILEESESPKILDDLKPWKIDDRFHHEDCMDELHKFYKSYAERMRKFDIFNYQKMYAIGFLQLKDPLRSISTPKPSGPTLKSLFSHNFWPLKPKSSDSDPMTKFMKELQSDLEVVYVGHMCLSWEFLHWQYGKALDLWDSDPRGMHRYNEVAGEFQQFQVLMQRFIEDEHFQGPRVQYYIKQRCLSRNLLQVPVIKEDNLKGRRRERNGEKAEYVISSEMLVEIMEESIRIFWRFVRADKGCNSLLIKGHKGAPAQLRNPADLDLLMEVKKILHKKERKLKDMVRSGNCITRRFKKSREDDVDQVLYFFSQVDMKLVSRVLNMTRITTEQLIWCHSILSRISFENRKIQVEPSFLLFPCQ